MLEDGLAAEWGEQLVEAHAGGRASGDDEGGGHVSGEVLRDELREHFAIGASGGAFLEDLHDLAHLLA